MSKKNMEQATKPAQTPTDPSKKFAERGLIEKKAGVVLRIYSDQPECLDHTVLLKPGQKSFTFLGRWAESITIEVVSAGQNPKWSQGGAAHVLRLHRALHEDTDPECSEEENRNENLQYSESEDVLINAINALRRPLCERDMDTLDYLAQHSCHEVVRKLAKEVLDAEKHGAKLKK